MKKIKKEEIIGFSGAAIIVLLALLLLTHLFLRAENIPKESEVLLLAGGVMLNQGDVDWQGGTFTPHDNIPEPVVNQAPVDRNEPSVPSVITDDTDNSAAIRAEREKKEKEEREAREKQEKERREAEERRRQQEINNQMSNAFGSGNSGSGQGSGQGTSGGNQGTTAGGSGGFGEFDLGGRGLYPGSALPRPAYTVQEEGTIVIEITVSPQGNVIAAQVRTRGTNITNESMRRSAVEAARKARFAVVNESNNQYGTITYRYRLN